MLSGTEISGDIYSWHNGLNWILHERAWYLLVGWLYKSFGITGLVIFSQVCSITLVSFILIVNHLRNRYSSKRLTFCLLLAVLTTGIWNSDIRPQIISIPITVILMVLLCDTNNDEGFRNEVLFLVAVIINTLFHGSTVAIVFLVYGFKLVVDVIFEKKFSIAVKGLTVVLLGVLVTIILSGGIENWLYLSKQSCYPEIMESFSAWKQGVFKVKEIIVILLVLIGLVLREKNNDDKVSKELVLNVGYYCMFIVATVIYLRMILYLIYVVLYFMPIAIDGIFSIVKLPDKLPAFTKLTRNKNKYLYANAVLICITVLANAVSYDMFGMHTFDDVSKRNAYDLDMIQFIKSKNYSRIYNCFDIGTWLAYYDIKVHIDNRVDPYLASYSGVDCYHNYSNIKSLTHLNDFVEEYHPDALIFYYNPNEDMLVTNDGKESYKHSNEVINFISEIDTYASDKFIRVYDNVVESSDSCIQWLVYEPIY